MCRVSNLQTETFQKVKSEKVTKSESRKVKPSLLMAWCASRVAHSPRLEFRGVRRRCRARRVRASAEASEDPEALTPEVVVVGLGPGDPGQVTMEAWNILTEPGARVHVRTARHPTLEGLPPHVTLTTFDHVYESTKLLQDVYPAIADELFDIAETVAKTAVAAVEGASQNTDDVFSSFQLEDDDDEVSVRTDQRQRHIVYAVPGDPCVAENSVRILRERAEGRNVKVTIVPGLSFLEPTLAAVGVDVMPSLCVVDAIDVASAGHAVGMTVDAPTLLCQVYSNQVASDVKLTLMQQYPEDHSVKLVHAAGNKDREIVETVPLHSIDRSEHIDILTSLFVPAVGGSGVNDDDSENNSIVTRGSVESVLDEIHRARRGDVEGEAGPAADDENEDEDDKRGDSDSGTSESFDDLYFGDASSGDSVYTSLDHFDGDAADLLRETGTNAAVAAENDDDVEKRKETLGALLAAVSLHVAMASEAGEFTLADVVVEATKYVRKGT